ncbi:MAG TPA: VWA domain-containing protein, partial [Pyrinomonadaceae bacterium]|nr:VWA domain-containing protein [Pyrinomonadaceae bacterium]
MKVLPVILLIILGLFSTGLGQSGRRAVKPESTPTSASQIQVTQDVRETGESTGYSESLPNAPRSISTRPRNNKKEKKETRKKAPATTQTAGTENVEAVNPDEEVVKVETNLVTMPVSVYDRNGLYIPNLRQTDFKIFEDGVEQEIAYFGTSEQPFTVILLIDVSPSTEYKIDDIQAAAIAFVDLLKPQDNVMVIQFDERVSVLAELTNDRQKIHKAIRQTNFGGGTSLYEAVDLSLKRKLNKVEGRKAIVLFTDGVDTTSIGATFESTVEDAEESEAMIFPIYYNTFLNSRGLGGGGVMSTPPTLGIPPMIGGGQARGTSSAEYTRGRIYLTELAAATGGRVFRPESTPGGLTAAFEGIAEELRRQYNIGYYPQTEGEPGQRKQIKVRVNRP